MAVHAYTSFSYSYLNRARVLAESLRRYHPDWIIWAVITDQEPPGYKFDASSNFFDHAIKATDLFGAQAEPWLFGMDVVEACTAVKAEALKRITECPGADKILYFDPDIAVFSNLSSIIETLDEASIALTPHQVDPEPADATLAIMDNEISALQYGSFNLGFLAVKNDDEARRFAKWWSERLKDWCHDRLDIGVFVDQKWCNLVPCFFSGVRIIRDPGCNVASWNISQRKVTTNAAGDILVNGEQLKFFHFTKLGPVGDAMTRRYAGSNIDVYEIWWWYSQKVRDFTDPRIPKGWWKYGRFDNGREIPKSVRELYRNRKDLQVAFPRPFNSGDGFFQWLLDERILEIQA